MRTTLTVILAVCVTVLFSAGAMAGDYHVGTGLKCYQCHIMHATKSHAYTGDSHDDPGAGAVEAYDKLLKDSDTNATCLECHNEGDKKDVYGLQDDPALNRIGGWFMGDSAEPYAEALTNTFGHDLKNGLQTPPGGSAMSSPMTCGSCHDVHGNAHYRNLKDFGSGGITYATEVNDPTKDVFQLVKRGYDVSNITYNKPSDAGHHYEQFCVSCHTNVHSDGTTGGSWLKHPTFGHSVDYTEGTISPLKTLGGTPEAGGAGDPVAGDVSCVTCHKAHGSSKPFGLIYDNRTTAALEDATVASGSANIRLTCKHCHAMGLTANE